MRVDLTGPQHEFFIEDDMPFPALVAGYGSGKTQAAVCRALRMKFKYPQFDVAYYLPTYPLIKDIAMPRFEEFLQGWKVPYKINKTDKELRIPGASRIIFRSMDNPESIIGYETCDSITDEIDTLPTDKAENVWRKVLARNRSKKPDGMPNTIGAATTPEGFKFVYNKWVKDPFKGSKLIQASTYSNMHNLPDEYIANLIDQYPEQQIEAYLNGQFVNLTQGTVYTGFDRIDNACDTRVIVPGPRSNYAEPLHIGMDFNVGNMAAVIHVLRDGAPHAVDEITSVLDTPSMIVMIKQRYEGHQVIVYPDASGKSRKSVNATESDLALLRQAGFQVLAHSKNPFVKDRVMAFNKQLELKRYRVNIDRCPSLVEALEKQAYDKNGEPDKSSGFDHVIDGAGYFVAYRFPVQFNRVIKTKIQGI